MKLSLSKQAKELLEIYDNLNKILKETIELERSYEKDLKLYAFSDMKKAKQYDVIVCKLLNDIDEIKENIKDCERESRESFGVEIYNLSSIL